MANQPKPGAFAQLLLRTTTEKQMRELMRPALRKQHNARLRWPDRVDCTIVPDWEKGPNETTPPKLRYGNTGKQGPAQMIGGAWSFGNYLRAAWGQPEGR